MTDPVAPPSRLALFVSEERQGFRVYAALSTLPRALRPFFDSAGEAFPVPLLDLEELDRIAAARGAQIERRVATSGGVMLSAEGASAGQLSRWLATAFASGIRPG